jgi:CRP-like cAMP-binding protein
VRAGGEVVRVGEPGEDFFIVDSGSAVVLVDGESKPVEPGGYFGEIALLRDVPRTATVRAVTDLALYALDRDQFIGAVTGHAASRDAADVVIGERLGALRAGTLPV